MSLVSLSFLVCLVATPDNCQRIDLPVELTMRECTGIGAQSVIASWIAWQWRELRVEWQPGGAYQCSDGTLS